MARKQNIVPLKELNLTDRFLFDETMEDPETHRETLSILLGKDISFKTQQILSSDYRHRITGTRN